jgi:endonuclease YncB( thermonuclease family)
VTSFAFARKATHVFDHALVEGRGGPTLAVNARGEITVRWQGIDATELHYDPSLPGAEGRDGNYRQHHGEAAPLAIAKLLRGFAKGRATIACSVETEVETPNDVFDTYGRSIGTVWVRSPEGERVSLNTWMVRTGLAYPTYYASMTAAEIRELEATAAEAKRRGRGLWQGQSSTLKFDPTVRFRRGGPVGTGMVGMSGFRSCFGGWRRVLPRRGAPRGCRRGWMHGRRIGVFGRRSFWSRVRPWRRRCGWGIS